jgi:hypothetical protein
VAQSSGYDYWSVFWPGEGSAFAAGYSNTGKSSAQHLLGNRRSGPATDDDGYRYLRRRRSEFEGVPAPPGVAGVYREIGSACIVRLRREYDWALALKANPPPVVPR